MPVAASSVSVSGRVLTSDGLGVFRANVSMTDPMGNVRSAVTNMFGYYRFDNVMTGGTYMFAISAKGYSIASQNVAVNDNISNLDFSAGPSQ
jgi:hypothetical protein